MLNTFEMHCKTHNMATRYKVMPQRISLPPKTQLPWILHHQNTLCKRETMNHLMNTEETVTLHSLAELLEKFQQLKEQFATFKCTTPQSTPTKELMQLTDKLQHLTMILQLHSAPQSSEDQCTKPCRHTQRTCVQHRENQTSPQPCSKVSPHLMDRTPQS